MAMRIGLISDTHGLLRSDALSFLQGSDLIVHAGDIGGPDILQALSAIAPLTVVRGNNDRGPWAASIRETEWLQAAGINLYAIHDLAQLDVDPAAAGIQVVVSGHSHQPRVDRREGVLYVNPGSPGPRRFRLPISIGELLVGDSGRIDARTVELG
jgi:putative phosphoesterase